MTEGTAATHLFRVCVGPQREEHIAHEGLLLGEANRGSGLLAQEPLRQELGYERPSPEPGESRVEVDVCAR